MPDIVGIGSATEAPLASSHRFIKLISSDCDLLIRAPSKLRFLFCVCDLISAVISTACAWCMIIPCMNSTSLGELGGSVALVEDGSVRVGWPGAPGCTTTGVAGSACCAKTGSENKPARVLAVINPPRNAAIPISDRSLCLHLK